MIDLSSIPFSRYACHSKRKAPRIEALFLEEERKEGSLLQKHHLLRFRVASCLQAIEVHT